MSNVNIFRYRPQQMKEDQFYAIAEDLRMDGEFSQGEEGMILFNKNEVLTWSQPNAKFGGLLQYIDRRRSLSQPAEGLPDVDGIRDYMNEFLDRQRLMPTEDGYDVTVKLESKVAAAMMESEEGKLTRVPMRVDVSSHIQLDGLPVIGPRAKIRAAFGEWETPQFLHVGLWESVELYKKGELIPKDRLATTIDERTARRDRESALKVRDIDLAYWAREYQGGADILEPYYFVEIEHLDVSDQSADEGSGPRQVLQFLAYSDLPSG